MVLVWVPVQVLGDLFVESDWTMFLRCAISVCSYTTSDAIDGACTATNVGVATTISKLDYTDVCWESLKK